MVINLKNSEINLLKILIDSEVTYKTEDLSEMLNISRRSLFYLMKNTSKKLIQSKIEPIKNIRGEGYYLSTNSKKMLNNLLNINSNRINADTRQAAFLLLLIISSKSNTLNKISKITNVTLNTVLNDQKVINLKIKKFNLKIQGTRYGHEIIGDEKNIRSLIQEEWMYLYQGYKVLHDTHRKIDRDVTEIEGYKIIINKWLNYVESNSYFYFSDDSKHHLMFVYSLIVSRINHHHELLKDNFGFDREEEELLCSHQEHSLASDLLKRFGFNIDIRYEIYYLESIILGLQLTNIGSGGIKSIKKIVRTATIKVIKNFEKLSGQSIKNYEQLLNELSVHLLSTFYRVKYHHQYGEDIVTKIQKQYYAIYTYTRLAIRPFELLNNEKLNENEIALITIYFGAQLLIDEKPVKSVLLVCSSGLGTSRLLKVQLEKEFPEIRLNGPITKSMYDNLTDISSEIIFSTIPLNDKGKEVFQVSPILTIQELNVVRKILAMHNFVSANIPITKISAIMDVVADNATIKNYETLENRVKEILSIPEIHIKRVGREYQPLLSELVNKKTISFANANHIDWREAIKIAAEPLIINDNIEKKYVNAMIKNVQENGPYINIGHLVAFAHARPDEGVKNLGMSMLHLSHPIDLVNEQHPIQLIFVLAAINDTAHIRAMSELATLLGNKETLNRLISAKDFRVIENTILEGEKQHD